MRHLAVIATALAGVSLSAVQAAHAFHYQTSVSTGCHERITGDAIARAGWPAGAQPPALTDGERRVADAVPFSVPADARNPWTLSLLIGVRYNDIHDKAPTHINDLIHIHSDPRDQPAHCMRMAEHDGPAGDALALETCRRFILEQIELALGTGDDVQMGDRIEVPVYLTFQGTRSVSVSRFAFRVGSALHTLQDSYTHVLRDPADGRVRHVMNWIDFARASDYHDVRDGYGHIPSLDDCSRDAIALAQARATEASVQLLAALANNEGGRDGRLERVRAVLDDAFEISPGCVRENDYCEAPELRDAGGCNAQGGRCGALFALFLIPALAGRRRIRVGAAAMGLVLLATTATNARADHAQPAHRSLAVAASAGASFDNGAGAASVGLRWFPTRSVGLGADVEYNPWFSIGAGRAAAGSANAYGSLIVSHRDVQGWKLRSSASLGTSMLLFDMVGVDRGAVGLYLGASVLSVVVPMSESVSLVIEPASVAMPVPNTRGMPFYYRQYRTAVGIEWSL